jgi:hypothetical protein
MTLIFQNLVRVETDAFKIATLQRKGWTEQPAAPAVNANQQAVWENGAWVVKALVPYVPQEVQTWALREAVEEAGKTTEIEAVIATLPTANLVRFRAVSRWNRKPTIRRDAALFNVVKQAAGWTDAFIDGLFTSAETISQS